MIQPAAYAAAGQPNQSPPPVAVPQNQLRVASFDGAPSAPPLLPPPANAPVPTTPPPSVRPPPNMLADPNVEILPVDLPTALRLTNANNPTIALARERVEEAYAAERLADVAWLPNLQGGAEYLRHDGRDQTTQGPIIEVSKQSLYVNGAATLEWNTSDILFGPLVAARLSDAQGFAAQATSADVQLSAAQAYLDLLQICGALAVNADTLSRTQEMLSNSEAADKAGLTITAGDINRARAEYNIRAAERVQLQGDLGVVSARLAHILLLRPTIVLRPNDPKIVPITLVPDRCGPDELVMMALQNRPEVREGEQFSAAAMTRLRQAKLAPLLPHVDVTYFGGTFGGGVDSQMGDFGARSDGEVDLYWQLHNLGAGDAAITRERAAQLDETNFQLAEIRAQVGEDVTAAFRQVEANRQSLESAEQAVRQSLETWRRLREASFGMAVPSHPGAHPLYDPLQPLIAERDLDQARTAYLNAVIAYNKAEFRLYWALGQPPLEAPARAQPRALSVPVMPDPRSEEVPLPGQMPAGQMPPSVVPPGR